MPGTTFVRRQLGLRLRRLREKAGLTQEGVAAGGIMSEVTLWRVESGNGSTHWTKVRALCELYGADDATTQTLIELAKASKEGSGWFEQFGDAIPETLRMYLSAETSASAIRGYDPEIVPGALQTESYTRALFMGELPDSSPERVDRLVVARLERRQQYWMGRPGGATLCVILSEGALAREVGGRATMEAQVDHLRACSEQRGVEVFFLPWSVGAHPAIYGGFMIFEFSDPADPTLVYTESYTGGSYLDDPTDADRMNQYWKLIHHLAKPIKEYHGS